MKKIIYVVLALVIAFSLVACTPTEPVDDGGAIKVGIINNPPEESGYRAANVADFKRVFEAEGYETEFFYDITLNAQLDAATNMITGGVDYLLISAAEADGWDDVLNAAKEAGVKVFLFDRMINCDPSLYEAAVVSNMASQGDMAVQWLKDQALEAYNIIHIQGAMGSDAQQGRTGALDAAVAANDNWNYVTQQTATWDEATAKTIVETVINAGDKFNVIYAENDGMARGAVAALDAANITHGVDGDVIIIGFDCNAWALEEVLAGRWNLDVQCSPFQADKIAEMITLLEAGGTIAEKKVINPETYFEAGKITQEDIDKYGLVG